jgi:hypothetical protein
LQTPAIIPFHDQRTVLLLMCIEAFGMRSSQSRPFNSKWSVLCRRPLWCPKQSARNTVSEIQCHKYGVTNTAVSKSSASEAHSTHDVPVGESATILNKPARRLHARHSPKRVEPSRVSPPDNPARPRRSVRRQAAAGRHRISVRPANLPIIACHSISRFEAHSLRCRVRSASWPQYSA